MSVMSIVIDVSGDRQMISDSGRLTCEWCGTRFDPRSWRGRLPRFCRASHRVRACERRRGLLRAGRAPVRAGLPAAGRSGPIGVEIGRYSPLGHERGLPLMVTSSTMARLRIHRVRVGGLPGVARTKGGRLVPSLCGVMVEVVGNPVQSGSSWNRCRSCERLAVLHPVDERWWDAMTQRTAGVLLDDIQSTILAVGQAVAGGRDPVIALGRVERELRHLGRSIGFGEPLAPSLHHRSVRPI